MAVELFFDLLYVGIIHSNGEHMSEEPNGHELLRFAITFMMSWKIWTDITSALNWFETDDLLTRLEILFAIACLLAFTTNMTNSFAEDKGYSVVGILFQSKGGYSVNAFLGKAVLGLLQAFTFNWIYFDIDSENISQHAIRRSATAATLWQLVHLPFVMAYIIST
ncbi:bacterial low temperature requirement A protein (LtrA) domain-containing protein [Hirsutella rhossiliensis]|uniref:Bacterial low temperature requirement A protein (LtrA) domain-containing protein n=1 Tax=Hirsutella rhossiliensis TaxID=111463 RepID=A0A9P8MPD1_9HYPO|nr:bacterial low temperature requirement A protein (LtrA) domain-containing protein [Hirsutella rhossiliensis]KAH0958079.1 bacterial low temperature requirement A protein (LtrA) domain-containing protein [Hirsutella rhossiliensis]